MPRRRAEFIVLQNPDKEEHEAWDEKRSLANFPRPWRAVACGPPSVGKSTLIANLIAHARPPYERIIVASVDPDAAEWTAMCPGCEVVEGVPDFREIERGPQTLVILEDLPLGNLRGQEAENLDRLFGHGSSHRGISVIATAQDIFRLPVCVRRQANIFHLWSAPDVSSLQTVAERVGLKRGELLDLFRKFCARKHDFITLDLTDETPAPIRYNLVKKIRDSP